MGMKTWPCLLWFLIDITEKSIHIVIVFLMLERKQNLEKYYLNVQLNELWHIRSKESHSIIFYESEIVMYKQRNLSPVFYLYFLKDFIF